MWKDRFKTFFQAWCSAQSVILFLVFIFFIELAVKSFELSSAEVASWVQALGAIISIWAVWWIAIQQSKRAEEEKRHSNLAKSTAILGLLEYALRVVQCETPDNRSSRSANDIRDSLKNLLVMLDRVDLLLLPSSSLVSAVLEVRHAVEVFDSKIRDWSRSGSNTIFSIHYDYGLSRTCKVEIGSKIDLCKEVVKSFS